MTLAVFILLAAVCSIVFNRIKLPPLIGYIVAGIIIANVWTVTPESYEVVEILSDIGLVMLMFCIGLEINLKKIRKQGIFAIKVAVIQLPLMVLGGAMAGTLLGFNMVQCICLGAIISGSSTAVVMAVLKSQNRLDKEHIEMLVLITIMEDIGQVIILSMITPLIAGSTMNINEIIVMFISIFVFMIISLLVGLRLVPRMINWVSDNVSDEILTVFSVGLAFSMALLSIFIGLSMAIGAFLMGMMISASRKSKEINHKIEPMRDLFMAVFFIDIGMKITVGSLVDNIGLILIIYVLFAVLKVSTVFLAYWIGGETGRNGFISATALVAMGEFAFIIAAEAHSYGVADDAFYTSVVGAALVSMVVLPFLTRYAPDMWDKGVMHCPKPIYGACNSLNCARDNIYTRISATSKRSQKTFMRSMTHSYINLLVIAAIEIVFYLGIKPAVDWLSASFGGDSLIQVFSLDMKPDVSYSEKDTMVNLLVETGSDVVFLFDTPDFGTAAVTESVASGEGRSSVSGVFPYTVTLYVYDAMNKEDRVLEFHGNGTGKSSAYIDGDESRDEKLRMLKENLAGEARTAGQNSVSAFRTGWKKENVFFYIYDNDQWYRAYYAAADYDWQKAMDIWMSMLDTKNMEKKACLEFNLATACYIQGRYDLAEEWIELSAKDMQLPLTGSMQRTISSKL